MGHRFLNQFFGQKKTIPPVMETVSDFRPIKPAKDIMDFEYPPESAFYNTAYSSSEEPQFIGD